MGNHYDEWAASQTLKGRTPPTTTAPYTPPGCINRDPEHLEKYTAKECAEYTGEEPK